MRPAKLLFASLFICLTSAAQLTTAQHVQTNPKPTNRENHIALVGAANHDAGQDGYEEDADLYTASLLHAEL